MIASRRNVLLLLGLGVLGVWGLFSRLHQPFPSDRTPEGAYLRIAQSVVQDDPRAAFAYLETEAQWASYTVRDNDKKAADRIAASYPEPQRSDALAPIRELAAAPDGSDAFAWIFRKRGWSRRLRKDLSGVARVDFDGERATVVTVQGTRYPFRKRENGIWGLTIFTAELLADAEKTTRDLAVVEAAARDYDRLGDAGR